MGICAEFCNYRKAISRKKIPRWMCRCAYQGCKIQPWIPEERLYQRCCNICHRGRLLYQRRSVYSRIISNLSIFTVKSVTITAVHHRSVAHLRETRARLNHHDSILNCSRNELTPCTQCTLTYFTSAYLVRRGAGRNRPGTV